MRNLKTFLKFSVLGAAALFSFSSCSGGSDMPDMAKTADMTFFSCCGHSGDQVNNKGIGGFCTGDSMCTVQGTLCATHEPEKRSYFCTTVCQGATDTTTCGTGATCTKDSSTGLYGCVPNSCLTNMPAGCMN